MYNFRKIEASEPIFKETRDKFENELSEFRAYAQMLTDEAGKSKKTSGKAQSYVLFIVRLIIFHQEATGDEIQKLTDFGTLKKLEKIKDDRNFKKFNTRNGNFYSASLNCYIAYVTNSGSAAEEKNDERLNYELSNEEVGVDRLQELETQLITGPVKKPSKNIGESNRTYPRNKTEALAAKIKSNWLCEFDGEHRTFTNIKNNLPFIEAHHLIPMAAQDYFENSIDFADNIVCLCPNCHRRIHYGIAIEKKEMVVALYSKRKSLYSSYEIKIEEEQLLKYYGII